MNECYLRFWDGIAAQEDGVKLSLNDKLILTKSNPLIHCECQFSDAYAGISFSSTLRDGARGCRFKQIDYSKHPKRWKTLILPMTNEEEERAYAEAQRLDGKLYDLAGLATFNPLLHTVIKENPNRYWCSEADAELIKAAKKLGDDFIPSRYTPVGLFFTAFDWPETRK